MASNYQIFKLETWAQCLCSAVENLSTSTVYFPFPKHGTTLGSGEVFYFLGNMVDQLSTKRYKVQHSLLKALNSGKLRLRQTPAAHWTYILSGTPIYKMIVTQNSGGNPAILITDPCWKPA